MPELTIEKNRLLNTDGHILALGGPGSGKTYIALRKAEHEIQSGKLLRSQHVLFLSFARPTIARVAEQAGKLISIKERRVLEINTYHGFAWKLLQSHAYLLNAAKKIQLLPPPEAAARLAGIDKASRTSEKRRLFEEDGLLHFDLFAALSAELLSKSKALARIICDAYPIIILDEFQDTNADEWRLIQALGVYSRLIALADAEQRIYEFRGADPKRISEFATVFSATHFDFGSENNRSNGTDIVTFGNDLLVGANKTKDYKNVSTIHYQVRRGNGIHFDLKCTVLSACSRLRKKCNSDWSLAVLVPSKRLMLEVSDYLAAEHQFSGGTRLPSISHDVAIETAGPALAAVLIASLLEGTKSQIETTQQIIRELCVHMRGRSGDELLSQGVLSLSGALGTYLATGFIKGSNRKRVVEECSRIAEKRHGLSLTGDPGEDWVMVRKLLEGSIVDPIQKVANDAQYLRLLRKGAILRSRLSELWRMNSAYTGAADAVRAALLQEHFSTSIKKWRGIHVMTIHKAKGKEFDEVIIYEGCHQGRIVRSSASDGDVSQARFALRVAVTRAMKHATILTPNHDKCCFL